MTKDLPIWYNVVEGVRFEHRGPVSDPVLHYRGHRFNYWDISDALSDMFYDDWEELHPEIDPPSGSSDFHEYFEDWITPNRGEVARDYLDDVIAGGYEY